MNKMFLRLPGLTLVLLLAFSGVVLGTPLSPIGEPTIVGSWAQTFQWYPPPEHIDKIESFIVSGATDFEAPGLKNFSNGWLNGTLENPDYTFAHGAVASSAFTFQSVYTANPDVPFSQDFIGWYNGAISEAWRFVWQGSGSGGWQVATGVDIKPQILDGTIKENMSHAPLPPTLLLLGSGLLGLALLRGRKLFKN